MVGKDILSKGEVNWYAYDIVWSVLYCMVMYCRCMLRLAISTKESVNSKKAIFLCRSEFWLDWG